MISFTDFNQAKSAEPAPDMCKCSECETEYKVTACIKDYGHHDGWEMPAYTQLLCPTCKCSGCVDYFYFSKESKQ